MHSVEIKSLHIYPVKSCGAIDLTEATIEARGFGFDRNWMVVEPDGTKLTQREYPQMALIEPLITEDSLVLTRTGQTLLEISLSNHSSEHLAVDIWGHKCLAIDEGRAAAAWLSTALERDVRLVRFDPDHLRSVDAIWVGDSGAHTGFADILPFLITSEESLAALNHLRQAEGLPLSPMNRFRPNIVIASGESFAEDRIPALRLPNSEAKLELVRPCSRCPITNIDQDSGEREKRGNLQILAGQRLLKNYQGKPGAMFGVQAIATGANGLSLKVGDLLEVTELSEGLPPLPRLS